MRCQQARTSLGAACSPPQYAHAIAIHMFYRIKRVCLARLPSAEFARAMMRDHRIIAPAILWQILTQTCTQVLLSARALLALRRFKMVTTD